MKQFMTMLLLSIVITVTNTSCEEQYYCTCRIRILEDNTIDYIEMTDVERHMHQIGDTIWVNPNIHRIENSDTTMEAVIIPTHDLFYSTNKNY